MIFATKKSALAQKRSKKKITILSYINKKYSKQYQHAVITKKIHVCASI